MTNRCLAGHVLIDGTVKSVPYPKAYLAHLVGGQNIYLDSASIVDDHFTFTIHDSVPQGMYSIVFSQQQNSFIRVLVNGKENIVFKTAYNTMLDSIRFSSSEENKVYYAFVRFKAKQAEKKTLLSNLIKMQIDNRQLVVGLKAELAGVETKIGSYSGDIAKKYPHSMAPLFIKALTTPSNIKEASFAWQHFLDNVDFSSIVLHRSDVLVSAALNFLKYARNDTIAFEAQAERYALVIDDILMRSQQTPEIYNFFRTHLSDRFMYGRFDIIGNYITQYYTLETATLPRGEKAVMDRIEKLGVVTIGKKAPQIIMEGYNGSPVTLDSIGSEYTLLVFWSTGCSHCAEMMPALKKLYSMTNNAKLEVLAISFDTNKEAWSGFVRDGNYSWMNYTDLKGWKSNIATTYKIKGTPTYILLDKRKVVIDKPATLEDLVFSLKSLNII